jgi:hypothetical protein
VGGWVSRWVGGFGALKKTKKKFLKVDIVHSLCKKEEEKKKKRKKNIYFLIFH